MTPNALTSLCDVKRAMRATTRWANLTQSAREMEEDFIDALIDEVSEYILGWLDRNPKNVEVTQYAHGDLILLDEFPLIELLEAQYDPTLEWDSPQTLAQDEDYFVLDSYAGLIKLSFQATTPNSVKLRYKAGYAYAQIPANAVLPFSEDGGTTTLNAQVEPGLYDAWTLATAVETALNSTGAFSYSVSFDSESQAFTVTADDQFTVQPSKSIRVWEYLGFDSDASGTSLTSQFPVPTVPRDLQRAATELVIFRYKYFEKDRVAVTSEAVGEQTITYSFVDIPRWIRRVLDRYRRKSLG